MGVVLLSWALAATSSIAEPPAPPVLEHVESTTIAVPGWGPRPLDVEPQRSPHSIRVGLTELFDPGAKGGGIFVAHYLEAGLSLRFFSGLLGLDLSTAAALATPIDTSGWSARAFLGNPQLLVSTGFASRGVYGRLGAGLSFPFTEIGHEHSGSSTAEILESLDGTGSAPRWSHAGSVLFSAELGIDREQWWASARFKTAIVPGVPEPGGDFTVEGALRIGETIAIGAQLGLAYYKLPHDRIVRICVADDPALCGGNEGSAPFNERFGLSDAILRAQPFVTIDIGPELRLGWTFLVYSVEEETQLYGRHQLNGSLRFEI